MKIVLQYYCSRGYSSVGLERLPCKQGVVGSTPTISTKLFMTEFIKVSHPATSMSHPIVSIIGRPGVGKSTLFNRLLRRRRAITHRIDGVTRDVIAKYSETLDCYLNDSAGIIDDGDEHFQDLMNESSLRIAKNSDLILFMLDGSIGMLPADMAIFAILRKNSLLKKTFFLKNKCDRSQSQDNMLDKMATECLLAMYISSEHNVGIGALVSEILNFLGKDRPPPKESSISIGIVGAPNVGKSTLSNLIRGNDFSIVSDIAGTTRDVVSGQMQHGLKNYEILDTAGIKKSRYVDLDKLAHSATIAAIRESDVVVFMIDSISGGASIDRRICSVIKEARKPVVCLVNKLDLEGRCIESSLNLKTSPFRKLLFDCNVFGVSLRYNKSLDFLFAEISRLNAINTQRIKTAKLNEWLSNAKLRSGMEHSSLEQIKFIAQTGTRPPVFSMSHRFQNMSKKGPLSILKLLRNSFDFAGIPIELSEMKMSEKTFAKRRVRK